MRAFLISTTLLSACASATPSSEGRGGMHPSVLAPSEVLCRHTIPLPVAEIAGDYASALAQRGVPYEPVDDLLDCMGEDESKCHARTFLFRHPTSGAEYIGVTTTSGRFLVTAERHADAACTGPTAHRTLVEPDGFIIDERVLSGCASGKPVSSWLVIDGSLGHLVASLACQGEGSFDASRMQVTCNGTSFEVDPDKVQGCYEEP